MVLLARTSGQFEIAILHGALLYAEKCCNGRLSSYVHERHQSLIQPVIKAFEEMSGSMVTIRRCLRILIRLVPQFQELQMDLDTEFIIVTWPCLNSEFLFDVIWQSNLMSTFIQVLSSLSREEQRLIVSAVVENKHLLLTVNVLEYLFLFRSDSLMVDALLRDNTFVHSLLKSVTEEVQMNKVEAGTVVRLASLLCRMFCLLAFADFGANVYDFKGECLQIEVGSSTMLGDGNVEPDVAEFQRFVTSLSKCDVETCIRLLSRPDIMNAFLCRSSNILEPLLEDISIYNIAAGLHNVLLLATDVTENGKLNETLSNSLRVVFPSNLRDECRLPLYKKLIYSTVLCCQMHEQFEASAELQSVWSTSKRFLNCFDEQLSQGISEDEFRDATLIVVENFPGAADRSLWLCEHELTSDQEQLFLQCVQSSGNVFMTARHFMAIASHLDSVSYKQQYCEVLLLIYNHLSIEDRNVILMKLMNCPAHTVLVEHSDTLLPSLKSSLVMSFNKIMGLTEHSDTNSLFNDISVYSLLAPQLVVEHLVGELFGSALQAKLMAQICHKLPALLCYTSHGSKSAYCFELLVDRLLKPNKSTKEIGSCLDFLALVVKSPENSLRWQQASNILCECALPLIDSWTASSDNVLTMMPIIVGLSIVSLCVEVTGFNANYYNSERCPRVVLLATLLAIVDVTEARVRDTLATSTLQSTALFTVRDNAADIVTRIVSDFSEYLLQDGELQWLIGIMNSVGWTTQLLLLDSHVFPLQCFSLPSMAKSCLDLDVNVELELDTNCTSVFVAEVQSVIECCKVVDIKRHPRLAQLLAHYCTHGNFVVFSVLTITLPSCSSLQWRNICLYLDRALLSSSLNEVFSTSTSLQGVFSEHRQHDDVSSVVTTVLVALSETHIYSPSHWQHMVSNYCDIVRDQITKVSQAIDYKDKEIRLTMLLRDVSICMKMLPESSKDILRVCLLELMNILCRKTDSIMHIVNGS